MIYPEFATCDVKTEPSWSPFLPVNMRFSLYLLAFINFENMYLHDVPI